MRKRNDKHARILLEKKKTEKELEELEIKERIEIFQGTVPFKSVRIFRRVLKTRRDFLSPM